MAANGPCSVPAHLETILYDQRYEIHSLARPENHLSKIVWVLSKDEGEIDIGPAKTSVYYS